MNLFKCKISFIFAWYDFWMGIYVDRKDYKVYILPIPMFGLVFDFGSIETDKGWNSI